VTLTAGSIRNGYVRLDEAALAALPATSIGGATRGRRGTRLTLHLSDGTTLRTDVDGSRSIFRTRRWRKWLLAQGARPGDRLRFGPRGRLAYDVSLVPGAV